MHIIHHLVHRSAIRNKTAVRGVGVDAPLAPPPMAPPLRSAAGYVGTYV